MLSSYLESHFHLLNHGGSTNCSCNITTTSHGKGATVLELGAAAGLPSLTAASLGARKVVATDYPDLEIIENLRGNVERNQALWRTHVPPAAHANIEKQTQRQSVLDDFDERDVVKKTENGNEIGTLERRADLGTGTVVVQPYLWGSDPAPLLAQLPDSSNGDDNDGNSDPRRNPAIASVPTAASTNGTHLKQNTNTSPPHAKRGFDLILMADLLYNHSCHADLMRTIKSTLARPSYPSPPSPPPFEKPATASSNTSPPSASSPSSASPQDRKNSNPTLKFPSHHPDTHPKPYPRALIFFTPYRPWLLDRDLAFFDLCDAPITTISTSNSKSTLNAAEEGQDQVQVQDRSQNQDSDQEKEEYLTVRKILEIDMGEVMFQDDPGDVTLRRMCFGYEVFWSGSDLEVAN